MNSRILISIFSVFFVILVTSCDRTEDRTPPKGAEDKKIDTLFKKAGVIRVQQLKDPIEIVLKDMDGQETKISDFSGKIIFLNFWATWCVPCRKEMPSMERLYQKFKGKDFEIIGINLEEPAEFVKEFFEEYKLTFISLLDSSGDVRKRFGIRAIPVTFILDKNQRIIGKAIGEKEWDIKESIALFEFLVNMEGEI